MRLIPFTWTLQSLRAPPVSTAPHCGTPPVSTAPHCGQCTPPVSTAPHCGPCTLPVSTAPHCGQCTPPVSTAPHCGPCTLPVSTAPHCGRCTPPVITTPHWGQCTPPVSTAPQWGQTVSLQEGKYMRQGLVLNLKTSGEHSHRTNKPESTKVKRRHAELQEKQLLAVWQLRLIIIIITSIYHALINILSAHIIHINLNLAQLTHTPLSTSDPLTRSGFADHRLPPPAGWTRDWTRWLRRQRQCH